mgnify:CR=1 FL=1
MGLYFKNKRGEKREVIEASNFRDAIEALYRGLETQKKIGKRVFNLNEGTAIHFTHLSKEYSFLPKEYTAHEILVRYSHLNL